MLSVADKFLYYYIFQVYVNSSPFKVCYKTRIHSIYFYCIMGWRYISIDTKYYSNTIFSTGKSIKIRLQFRYISIFNSKGYFSYVIGTILSSDKSRCDRCCAQMKSTREPLDKKTWSDVTYVFYGLLVC